MKLVPQVVTMNENKR